MFAAFVIGWMNLIGWVVALCSGVSVTVASVSGIAAFWYGSFDVLQWHLYLLYLVIATLSGTFHIILQLPFSAKISASFTSVPLSAFASKNTAGHSFWIHCRICDDHPHCPDHRQEQRTSGYH